MTGDEIFEQLKRISNRWGGNDQPSIYLITSILEQLPVEWLAGHNDTIQIKVSRDLTNIEDYMMGMLNADTIQKLRGDRLYDLWWD